MEKQKAVKGLVALMHEHSESRHDLMRAFDVSENTVRRWERGDGLTVATVNLLADHYGVSTDQILGREAARK